MLHRVFWGLEACQRLKISTLCVFFDPDDTTLSLELDPASLCCLELEESLLP